MIPWMTRAIFFFFFLVVSSVIVVGPERHQEPTAPKNLFLLSGQSNMRNLDVNKYFASSVEQRFSGGRVSIVKVAEGSKPISSWYDAHSETASGSSDPLGELYLESVGSVKEISGITGFRSVTLLWMQGERDAYQSKGTHYEKNFKGFLGQLSRDTGCKNINVVVGRLSDFGSGKERYPHWGIVRRAHENVAREHANIVWIDTDDLNDFHTGSSESPVDRLHYTEEGYKMLGHRFAKQSVRLAENFDCSSV